MTDTSKPSLLTKPEVTPNPDPTVLTTAALVREVDSLRERTTHDNTMLRELIEARLNGNDAAVSLLRTTTDAIPQKISAAVSSLQELHEEKFNSIGIQFKERDVRTDQTSRDSKVAVDAALKAQQEAFAEQNKSSALAISKSEAATTKQIDLIGGNIIALSKSIDDKFKAVDDKLNSSVSDVKERLTQIEARNQGVTIQKTENAQSTGQNWAYIVGTVGTLVGIASLIVSVLIVVGHH